MIWLDLDECLQDLTRSTSKREGEGNELRAFEGRLVGSVGIGFSCKDLSTDPLILVSGHGDPPSTFTSIESDTFRFGLGGLGG